MWRVIMSWGDCQDYVTLSRHRSRKMAERRMVEAARVLGAMGMVYHVEVTHEGT
jgi:hypothetical protein